MARDLKKIIDLTTVANELERAKRVNAGSVGFDPTWYDELLVALSVHAALDESTSDRDRLALCSEAISTVAKTGRITKARLVAELGRQSQRFLAQPRQPFVLLTTLSCRHFAELTPRRLDGWMLRFSDGCPAGFDRSQVPDHVWAQYGKEHRSLAHVRVRGGARTISEALETGLERLDCVRGIWNFVLNRRLWSQQVSHEGRPLNQVRIGPIHTIHLSNGKPAAAVWWYELCPPQDPFPTDLRDKWQRMDAQARAVRAVLKETPLGPDLRKIIVRYCRALDGGDPEVTLMHLWAILETLTATGGERYDATIARVRFLYEEEPLVWYVLEMLRERRNRTAHAGAGGIDARKAAIRLHRFVAALMTFAMQVSGKFASIEEFGEFLSMPRDAATLRQEIRVRQTALKFKGKGAIHGRKLVRK